MKRRKFIVYSSLVATAAVVPVSISCSEPETMESVVDFPRSLSFACDEDQIESMGREYHDKFPGESSVDILRTGILDGWSDEKEGINALKAFVETKIQSDFDKGDIVVLEGWVISRTEARQCALQYLRNI